MRVSTFLILCAVLTAGAFYGRYLFLRDKGYLPKETSFFEYVIGRKASKPESGRAKVPEEQKSSRSQKHKKQALSRIGKPKAKASQSPSLSLKEAPKSKPEELAQQVYRQALEAWQGGELNRATELLSTRADPELLRLAKDLSLFKALVEGVKVDPGAKCERIYLVRLTNGNELYAVKAERQGPKWKLLLANGIGCGLDADTVQSVVEQQADSFHRKRAQELEARLRQLGKRGGYGLWKGIRLAWRRGFAKKAYDLFKKLVEEPQLIAALQAVLPPGRLPEGLLAAKVSSPSQVRKTSAGTEGPAIAMRQKKKLKERGVQVPSGAVAPTSVSRSAYKEVDMAIAQARKRILQALSKEGAEADALLQEAGRLLSKARDTLLKTPNLPRDKNYQERLQQVTLILDDFLKMSHFGLKEK